MAPRVGMAPTTLHSHLTAGLLPSKIFKACCTLATEMGIAPPPFGIFSFVDLVPVADDDMADGERPAA